LLKEKKVRPIWAHTGKSGTLWGIRTRPMGPDNRKTVFRVEVRKTKNVCAMGCEKKDNVKTDLILRAYEGPGGTTKRETESSERESG